MKEISRIFFATITLVILTSITTAQQNKAEKLYQQGIYEMEGKGDYAKAIESFNRVLTQFPREKVTGAKALLNIGRCYEKLGKNEAQKAYERIIREFKDQTQVVAEARMRLAVLKQQVDIVTFAEGGSITGNSFSSKVDFATEENPAGVTFGDIDGDGKPDLIVANCYGNSVSVFRNTSSSGSVTPSSFAAKVNFPTENPIDLITGDFDGDGKPDLVVLNASINTISIFRNTSLADSISFAACITFATGARPYCAEVSDLDGDGKPDLVVSNHDNHTVSVFRNTSSSNSITFAERVNFTTESFPWGLAVGDIDGDGKPDLVVCKSGSNVVSVFRNVSASGSISFSQSVDFATGMVPVGIAIGDIDGDGKMDLIVTNQSNNTISVLRNTSSSGSITSGSFAAKVDFATGATPYAVAIGDTDGDRKPDLVVVNANSNTVSLYRNMSSYGSITSSSFAAKVDIATGTAPKYVAIGDMDGDGKPDLTVTNSLSNSVSIFRNTVSESLIGTWDKVSGLGEPIRYYFQDDATVFVFSQSRVDTADYVTFSIPSSDLRGIDLRRSGVLGWRGVYKISADSSVLQMEGYWYTGLPLTSTPTSFSTPTTYTKVTTGLTVQPYTSDANTVLLDHFDGNTGSSILAYSENSAACGTVKPSATPSYSYGVGPNGLNQALSLNAPAGEPVGSTTYLQYPGGQLLSNPNGTIEFWVFLTSYGTGAVNLVDQGPYQGSCDGWTFYLQMDNSGKLRAGAWAAFNMNSGSVKVPLYKWTHLATTWGSTGAKLYINGVLVGSDSNTGMPASGYGGSVLITIRSSVGADGSIDELRISNIQRTTFNVTN